MESRPRHSFGDNGLPYKSIYSSFENISLLDTSVYKCEFVLYICD